MLLKESGWMRIFTAFQFLFLLSLNLSVWMGFLRAGRYVPLYPGGQLKFGSIQFPLSRFLSLSRPMHAMHYAFSQALPQGL